MTSADIIDNHELSFDPGDPLNGSLYLCRDRGQPRATHCDAIVEKMRANKLWSEEDLKEVPDEHRDAYKQQLKFIERVSYQVDGSTIGIARFDHEKFPSDSTRWEQWKAHLDSEFSRL
jgi:hypothetical protein